MNKREKIIASKKGLRIDIGCGANKQAPDWFGVDYRKLPGVDLVYNLENPPYPLPGECASVAVSSHVVEHINPAGGKFIDFMNEIWRLLKPGAEFLIAAPYATSPGMFRDPTHCNFISEETWSYFSPTDNFYKGGLYRIYAPLPWEIKFNSWNVNGNIEVILKKLPILPEYHVDKHYQDVLKKNNLKALKMIKQSKGKTKSK